MARVPYVEVQDAPPVLRELYESNQRFTGRVPNFHKILGHLPDVYRWWIPLQNTIQRGPVSHLPPELRALASLATSHANRCRYCATHGTRSAIESGVAERKVHELETNPDADPNPDVFEPPERLVIQWARAVTKNEARRNTALFRELSATFTPQQIVQLTVTVAARTFTNLIQEALWTDIEESPEGASPQSSQAPAHVQLQRRMDIRHALHDHAVLAAEQVARANAGGSQADGS